MTVSIIRDNRYLEHDPGGGHPESPNRLRVIYDLIEQKYSGLPLVPPRHATESELALVHDPFYIQTVANTEGRPSSHLDADTGLSSRSYEIARLAYHDILTGLPNRNLLHDRLRQAAVSRLVSDVPLGVFLSGGLDSSTLVALMSELTPGNVNSFSVAFPEKDFNEEPYAQFVAQHFKTRHHVVTADDGGSRFEIGQHPPRLVDPADLLGHLV